MQKCVLELFQVISSLPERFTGIEKLWYELHISSEHNLIPHFGHDPMTLHLVVTSLLPAKISMDLTKSILMD